MIQYMTAAFIFRKPEFSKEIRKNFAFPSYVPTSFFIVKFSKVFIPTQWEWGGGGGGSIGVFY